MAFQVGPAWFGFVPPSIPFPLPLTLALCTSTMFTLAQQLQSVIAKSGSFVKRIFTRASGHARVGISKYRFEC